MGTVYYRVEELALSYDDEIRTLFQGSTTLIWPLESRRTHPPSSPPVWEIQLHDVKLTLRYGITIRLMRCDAHFLLHKKHKEKPIKANTKQHKIIINLSKTNNKPVLFIDNQNNNNNVSSSKFFETCIDHVYHGHFFSLYNSNPDFPRTASTTH